MDIKKEANEQTNKQTGNKNSKDQTKIFKKKNTTMPYGDALVRVRTSTSSCRVFADYFKTPHTDKNLKYFQAELFTLSRTAFASRKLSLILPVPMFHK